MINLHCPEVWVLFTRESYILHLLAYLYFQSNSRLRLLNLANNNLQCVPHLRLLDSRPAKPFDFSLKDQRYDAKPNIEKKKTKHNSGKINFEEDGKHEESSPKFGDGEVNDFKIEGLSVEKSRSREIGFLEESINPANGLEEPMKPTELTNPANGLEEPMMAAELMDPAKGLEEPIEQMVPPMELMVPPMDLNIDLSTDLNLQLDVVPEESDGYEWPGSNGAESVGMLAIISIMFQWFQ